MKEEMSPEPLPQLREIEREITELRSRLSEVENRLRAYGPPDEDSILRDRLLELVCDAIVEGDELELDETKVQRLTARRTDRMGDRVRAEAARRGLSLGELDAELGWPEGRTEDLLARPSRSSHEDVRRLSETLGIPMTSIFELESPERNRLGDDGQP